MAAYKFRLQHFGEAPIFTIFFKNSIVLDGNWLEPRSGPKYMGPDLGSSLFDSSTMIFFNFFKVAILYPSI